MTEYSLDKARKLQEQVIVQYKKDMPTTDWEKYRKSDAELKAFYLKEYGVKL